MGVVYCLTNTVNGKQYIGQTTRTVKVRVIEHKRSSSPIGNAIKKYGEEKFSIETLVVCDDEELDANELQLISSLKTYKPYGYNLELGGNTNKYISEETRQKMSIAAKKRGMAHLQGIYGFQGKKHSEETKKKMSASMCGKKRTKQACENISKSKTGVKHPNYGKKLSEETRNKMKATWARKKATMDVK